MKKAFFVIVVVLAVASVLTTAQQAGQAQTAPGHYIVVFKDTVADVPGLAYGLARAHGQTPRFVYEHALKGFAAELPEQAVVALSRNPNVAYIEPDSVVWAFDTESGATWGLDRIDQRNLPLDGTYTYDSTGQGVTAFIIDTGIRISHSEFVGRASYGWDFVDNDANADDCNGHGTHVAGTVGGTTYGVAKGVHLVAVRVLNCNGSGTTSGVIAGIDWVTAQQITPAVANMSLGGGASSSLDTAVKNSIASGISYAVAAGNGNSAGQAQNACNYSPSRVPEGMTVSATNSADTKASWANYGDCVDWFAPGVSITSAWKTNDTATNAISGTSMAAPHTTGVAALYLEQNPNASPQQVRDALYNATTKGIVISSKTVNNHLLYSLFSVNQPPIAGFTYSTTGLTASFTDTSTDPDGTISVWSWSFGDGAASTTPDPPSHTYTVAGTYSVTLVVTDNAGGTNSTSQSVIVASSPGTFTLSVTGRQVRNVRYGDLRWTGASGANVDVYRNGSTIANTANDGVYTDTLRKASGSYTYKVCQSATQVCSNEATIFF